jgi:diguanylate cyclase (GGDEF)-like protein
MDAPMNRRILLVDNLPSIHEDFRKIFARAAPPGEAEKLEAQLFDRPAPALAAQQHFDLTSAYRGEEAVPLVRAALRRGEPFAVAFVDMRMPPGWDGVQTISHLWREDPRLQMVICTAYSDHSWNEVLARLDVRDRLLVLKKPFDWVEVLQLANSLCARWETARRLALHTTGLELQLDQARQQHEADVKARSAMQSELEHVRHLALHDALTGLPNRVLLKDRLEHAVASALRTSHRVGLLFIDLDGFKGVNDAFGHEVGDRFLKQMAVKLQQCVRRSDTLARLGGDEFVVLLENLHDIQDAARLAEKIVRSVSEPVHVGSHVLESGASVGIACFPDDGRSAEELMKHADAAMYATKASGGASFRFFDTWMSSRPRSEWPTGPA